MGPILVFGHRNPDNDSVCSAVAYAHLKNLTDADNVYLPVRLGAAPPETEWAFARFGVDLPEEIEHVRTRVRDVMTEGAITVDSRDNLLRAGRLMRERGVRALPVVADGIARGLVNESILAERYIEATGLTGFREHHMTVGQVAAALDGAVLVGDTETQLAGDVLIGAMEPETMLGYIKPGDTLILGDRLRTQPMALEAGVACLVVSGGCQPTSDVLDKARATGAAIVTTAHDTYAAARLIELGHAVGDFMDATVLMVSPEALLSEAAEDLLSAPQREAIVVDGEGRPIGMLTRTNVARGARRRVVLVDHNELAQSAHGIEDAQVVEIVDHHRVGDVQTASPILFLNMPVGSTATIVAQRYEDLGVPIPEGIAGILLSALLSDTVLLKSPTTTDIDRTVARRLEALLGMDALEFGLEMFRARTAGREFSAEETVGSDLKEYRVGDVVVAIGQVETVDRVTVMEHVEEIRRVMDALRANKGYDLVLLMVTDVVREGSELVASGKTRIAERAFGVSFASGSVWMDGVLSRKKQVAARLVDAVSG